MSHTFERPGKALIRMLWAVLIVSIVLGLVVIAVFKINFPFLGPTVVVLGTIISILKNRPLIWREGDTLIFQNPAKKITKTKSGDAQVTRIVEWAVYDATLYDIQWKDGDVWTLPAQWGFSLETLTTQLKDFAQGEIPTEKDYKVFRQVVPSP